MSGENTETRLSRDAESSWRVAKALLPNPVGGNKFRLALVLDLTAAPRTHREHHKRLVDVEHINDGNNLHEVVA